MTVRNFQLQANVTGRAVWSAGPASATGGFDLVVYMRDRGASRRAVEVTGRADAEGNLVLRVRPAAINTGALQFEIAGNPDEPMEGVFLVRSQR